MPSLPRLLVAAVFLAVAVAAIVTIVRPRSRMSLVTLIAAFLFDVAAPGGDTTTRVWASAGRFLLPSLRRHGALVPHPARMPAIGPLRRQAEPSAARRGRRGVRQCSGNDP